MCVLHSRTVQKSSLLMFWNVPSLNEVVQSIEICGSITQYKKSIWTYTINKILPILSPLLPDSDGLLQPLSHAHLDVKTIVYEETDCNRNKKLNRINQLVYVTERNLPSRKLRSCKTVPDYTLTVQRQRHISHAVIAGCSPRTLSIAIFSHLSTLKMRLSTSWKRSREVICFMSWT